MVAKTEEAVTKTRRAASGFEGTIKVGFQAQNTITFLSDLIKNFRRSNPDIDLIIEQLNPAKLREELEQGLLDLVICSSFGFQKTEALIVKTLEKDPLCVVLHKNHPLAGESKIPRIALAEESFVSIDRQEAPFVFDSMIHDCVKCGFSPKIVYYGRTIDSILLMIEAEIGIGLLRRGVVTNNENLRFIDLEGENEYTEVVAAWLIENSNPTIPLFLKEVDKLLPPSGDH